MDSEALIIELLTLQNRYLDVALDEMAGRVVEPFRHHKPAASRN